MSDEISEAASATVSTPHKTEPCWCCGQPAKLRNPDPWDGRLDGYCYDCALGRCDAYPGECPNAAAHTRPEAAPES